MELFVVIDQEQPPKDCIDSIHSTIEGAVEILNKLKKEGIVATIKTEKLCPAKMPTRLSS